MSQHTSHSWIQVVGNRRVGIGWPWIVPAMLLVMTDFAACVTWARQGPLKLQKSLAVRIAFLL
jgi:hypothetical protein